MRLQQQHSKVAAIFSAAADPGFNTGAFPSCCRFIEGERGKKVLNTSVLERERERERDTGPTQFLCGIPCSSVEYPTPTAVSSVCVEAVPPRT